MALEPIASSSGARPAVANGRGQSSPALPIAKIDTAASTQDRPAAPVAPSPPDLSQQLEKLTRVLQETHSSLSFSVDSSTGKTIVRVVRSSTGELVRQIPSEEALAIAASLDRGEPPGSLGLERWS